MDQKQQDAMESIMAFGRIFADQITKCMENSGLLKEGYKFYLTIDTPITAENLSYETLVLRQSVGNPKWYETAMDQFRFGNGSWKTYDNRATETGFIRNVAELKTEKNVDEGMGKDTGKPYPPDGYWISSRDDYPILDGGQ